MRAPCSWIGFLGMLLWLVMVFEKGRGILCCCCLEVRLIKSGSPDVRMDGDHVSDLKKTFGAKRFTTFILVEVRGDCRIDN